MKTFSTTLCITLSLLGAAAIPAAHATDSHGQTRLAAQSHNAYDGHVSRGELDYPPPFEHRTELSRAEVVAQLEAARAAGQISRGELDYPPEPPRRAGKTRAEVIAERDAARAAGFISRGDLDYPPGTTWPFGNAGAASSRS